MGILLVGYMGYYISSINEASNRQILARVLMYCGVLVVVLFITCGSGYITNKLAPILKAINTKFTGGKIYNIQYIIYNDKN